MYVVKLYNVYIYIYQNISVPPKQKKNNNKYYE